MKIEWKEGDFQRPELVINDMKVGWVMPFGEGVRAVIAPKLREALSGPPLLIIYKTIEEAKSELEGICCAILIGEQYASN
jgi:hypothetical protein